MWLARSGCVALLPGDSYNFNSVGASPVEPLVATTSGGKVRLWRLPTGQPAGELVSLERNGFGVVFSADGRLLASGQGTSVHVWDVDSQRHVALVRGPTKQVQTVAFSPDGALIAAGDLAGELWIWRLADSALLQRIQAHPHFINRIAFIPQRNWLASVGDTASLRVWDAADGRLVYEVPAASGVADLAFTPDGTIGVLPLHRRVQRRRIADGALLDSWPTGPGNLMSIDVAPDGQTVVTGGDASDSVTRVWRLADGEPLAAFPMEGDSSSRAMWDVTFSNDGTLIVASGGVDDGYRGESHAIVWRAPDATAAPGRR